MKEMRIFNPMHDLGNMISVFVIYCHLSKLSVGQTPRLCSLPSKSFSDNINVPFTGGGNLVKESGEPFNGMPEKSSRHKNRY